MLPRLRFASRFCTSALGCALALSLTGSPALAQQAASIGAPSVLKVGESASISGNGLPANASVTVLLVGPSGAQTAFAAVTDARGRLDYRVMANAPGRWEVQVQDGSGRSLARAHMQLMP